MADEAVQRMIGGGRGTAHAVGGFVMRDRHHGADAVMTIVDVRRNERAAEGHHRRQKCDGDRR